MIRTILHYPDKQLRIKGERVHEVTAEVRRLVDDMAETMYAAPGVGLAATQVGVHLQLFIIDVAAENEPSDLRVFINPEILEQRDSMVWNEGCLSFPGINEDIQRASYVRVRAQDAEGRWFELEAEGLLAIAVQHEHDHLQGVLMIDHVGLLKKRLINRKMQRRRASEAEG